MSSAVSPAVFEGASWNEDGSPRHWFNVIPHLPEPLPPSKDPDDGRPSRIQLMKRIRIQALNEQDRCAETLVDIPEEIMEQYRAIGRPTPLYRARALEDYLGTPARIYFKREDLLPTGSFKLNSAIAQAYYARQEGIAGLVSETGAGQWGHALVYAASAFGLRTLLFWVRVSMEQKPQRAALLRMLGAELYPSPSDATAAGREILARTPDNPGSLGTSIADAVSYCSEHPEVRYVSGSNLSHVLLHQTVIGLEAKRQLLDIDETPDVLVACVGGGSNLGGFMNPFLPDKLEEPARLHLLAAESDAAPRLTRGEYRYDHADPVGITPLTLSYTLGMQYIPPPVHVGGLRQHSGSPVVGLLRKHGLLDARSYSQYHALKAGALFIRLERIVPAPESCHAVAAVIDAARAAKQERRAKVIVACLSGSGILDLQAYHEVLRGEAAGTP